MAARTTVSFKGDFFKFARLVEQVGKLGKPEFRARSMKLAAAEALELAHDGFARSISPYGRRWKNPKHRTGKPLLDTGRLVGSIAPFSDARRFELRTNVVYAAVHQWGWSERNIPQRQFLPDSATGFGGRWREALLRVMKEERRATLGR